MMLADIAKEEVGRQYIEKNNIRCKCYVKRTGVEQICDVAIIFNPLKQIENVDKTVIYSISMKIEVALTA